MVVVVCPGSGNTYRPLLEFVTAIQHGSRIPNANPILRSEVLDPSVEINRER